MNKLISVKNYSLVTLASIPLLLLGGCATNDSVKFDGDTSIAQNDVLSEVQNIMQSSNDVADVETGFNKEESSYDVVEVTLPSEKDNEVIAPAEATETALLAEKNITPKPGEEIIGFGFDKADVNSQYGELLWQHAQYLKENENLILHISGHTDNSGVDAYNRMLSKKRADEVATILRDFGAPSDRIKVSGNASDLPLAGAVNHREHRRVELDYQDQQLVSN